MALMDLPFFQAIRTKMQWHQSRQTLLTNNVANADTPGFRPTDLKALDFTDHLEKATAGPVSLAVTHSNHLAGRADSESKFSTDGKDGFEITPDGNGVVLEEQMMKVTANQMDYQAATSLYAKSLGILRTAIGRRA